MTPPPPVTRPLALIADIHGNLPALEAVVADIRARDDRDSRRGVAPLTQAPDAALLDTSFLSIDAAVQRAIALVEARTAAKAITA